MMRPIDWSGSNTGWSHGDVSDGMEVNFTEIWLKWTGVIGIWLRKRKIISAVFFEILFLFILKKYFLFRLVCVHYSRTLNQMIK